MKMTALCVRALALMFASGACAAQSAPPASSPAQAPAPSVGVMHDPCAALLPPPETPAGPARAIRAARSALAAASKAWEAQRRRYDFGGLCRYRMANAKLAQPGARRVVFMGDSITEAWRNGDPDLFTHEVIDRGISGQTTPQMLLRFRADVIDLHPAVVHILAGTNDIAGNTGPTSLEAIEGNIQSMVELARAHHIRVILASLTPAARYPWRADIEPVDTIRALNAWIKAYAKQQGLVYVDYFTPLDDGHGGFTAALTIDGVHPDAAGYAVMDKLARRAIEQALAASR